MHTDTDILEEDEEYGEEGEWVSSVARGVGTVVASVSGAIREAGRALPLGRPAPRRKRSRVDVRVLVRRLGEVVTAHERDGFEGLESDPEFWRLVALLSRAPHQIRFQRANESARPPVGPVIDADVKQEDDSE